MTTYPNGTMPTGRTVPVTSSFSEDPGHSVGGRTWTVTTDSGIYVSGHLPFWDEGDPSESGVPLERLGVVLSDINHHREVSGRFLTSTPYRAVGPSSCMSPFQEQATGFSDFRTSFTSPSAWPTRRPAETRKWNVRSMHP